MTTFMDVKAEARAKPVNGSPTLQSAPEVPNHPSAAAVPEPVPPAVAPMSNGARGAAVLIIVGALGLGLVGFVSSFSTVEVAMRPSFNEQAFLVPLGIDLGILVFSGLDILLAKLRMRVWWLRFIPWGLTAATIYLNAAADTDSMARVAHVVLPSLWVITSEVGAHVIRIRAGIAAGEHTESLGLARWLVAPVETARLWRLMIKHRLTTVSAAIATRDDHAMAAEALAERYGRKWTRYAPGPLRARYRQQRLCETDVWEYRPAGTPAPRSGATTPVPTPSRATGTPTGDAPGITRPRRAGTPRRAPAAATKSDADLIRALEAMTRDADGYVGVKAARRELGIGVDRARRLLAQAELLRPASPDEKGQSS
ncbi:MAG: DUF2637 domain-containing protein [Stackebrandtia sp.]